MEKSRGPVTRAASRKEEKATLNGARNKRIETRVKERKNQQNKER